MRLICPNCDAEYEVDNAAIPRDGRDVQCSACGHAWFQTHPEVAAEAEAEAALYEAPEGAIAPTAAIPEADEAVEDEDEDHGEGEGEAPASAPDMPSAAARGLDASMLAVLKEEAERETAARRAEAQDRPGLESQTEMPLPPSQPAAVAGNSMAAAVRRIARLRGVAVEDAGETAAPEETPVADAAAAGVSTRPARKGFPAIEEINQSLRASGERGAAEGDAVAETLADSSEGRKASGGFRRGFVTLLVLAVLIVALYQAAPLVAARVPALEGAATTYVAVVDKARIATDAKVQLLIGWLRGMAGGAQD